MTWGFVLENYYFLRSRASVEFRENVHHHRAEFRSVDQTSDGGDGSVGCGTFWTRETSLFGKLFPWTTFLWASQDSSRNIHSSIETADLLEDSLDDFNSWAKPTIAFLCYLFIAGLWSDETYRSSSSQIGVGTIAHRDFRHSLFMAISTKLSSCFVVIGFRFPRAARVNVSLQIIRQIVLLFRPKPSARLTTENRSLWPLRILALSSAVR